jgi:hypothetical protein
MDFLLIYLIIICSIVALPLLLRISTALKKTFQRHVFIALLKHFIYPLLYRRTRVLPPVTRFQFFVYICYATTTLLFNLWGVTTAVEASSRAGVISVANLIPLLFSGRRSLAADILGLNVQTVASAHTAMGLLVSIQATVHAVLATKLSNFRWENMLDFYGFLVSSKHIVSTQSLTSSRALLAWRVSSFLSAYTDTYLSSSLNCTMGWPS